MTSRNVTGDPHTSSVLMFAYFYPPCECWPTASARAEGLARGLTEHGWSPIVVTRSNGCPCLDDSPSVRTMGGEENGATNVEVRRVRVRRSLLARLQRSGVRPASKIATTLILLTEGKDDWPRRALGEARQAFSERTVDAVWTTSGPYRSLGVGRRLQREYGTPWVADLRDSIARGRSLNSAPGAIKAMGRRRWHSVLRKASAVTCVSPEEANVDSDAIGRPVEAIPSGFEPTTWQSIRDEAEAKGLSGSRFVIVYAGALYRFRDPAQFFFGLRRLLDTGVPEQSVGFVYLGPQHERVLAEASRHGVGHVVKAEGRVPLREAHLAMARANLLLLLSPVTGESGMPGGKLYEYLAAGPPILAIPGTDRFVLDVLRETGAGEGASTPDEVADALLRQYAAWHNGTAISRPLRDLDGFSWSARAGQLSELLSERVPVLRGVA